MGNLKTVFMRIILGCLGVIIGLALIEVGLHLIPGDRVDAVIERSARLQLYRLEPRIGWVLRPDARYVHITRDDIPIQIETNSLGLRDHKHTYDKPDGVYRILVLGDSFTEALDVNLEEGFPYLVEQCLNQQLKTPIEVINAGVSGYSPAEEYLFYTSEGIKYYPDLVLMAFYVGNDLSDLDRTGGSRMIRAFGGYSLSLNDGQLKWSWNSWENSFGEQVSSLQLFFRRNSELYRILAHPESKIYWEYRNRMQDLQSWLQFETAEQSALALPWYLYMHILNFPDDPGVPDKMKDVWSLFQAIIQQLSSAVEANGSQVAVVIIPNEYQAHQVVLERTITDFSGKYDSNLFNHNWSSEEPNLTIMSYLEEQQIPALDLLPLFRAHDETGGSLLYFDGGFPQHLNADGQRLMGDVLCDWLIRNKSIHLPRP
jgi:hypothetical protein